MLFRVIDCYLINYLKIDERQARPNELVLIHAFSLLC